MTGGPEWERKVRMSNQHFINFTNHPSDRWEEEQRKAALEYGEIIDLPFPNVSPQGDEQYIDRMAGECVSQILQFHPAAVLCQGEFCLAYQVICRLREKGIQVVAACSERIAREVGQKKETVFAFVQFRGYGR